MKSLKNFLLRGTALLMVLGSVMPANGQAVIMNGNYFLTHNEAGTSVETTATDDFNPTTCLWVFAQDDYIRTANSNGTAITTISNNYLQYTSLSLGTDWGNWYRARSDGYIYHRTGNNSNNRRYHYPTLSGINWSWISNSTSQGSTTYLRSCTITPHDAEDNLTNPTISISSISGNTINFSHTNIGGTYSPAYTSYEISSSSTHYWYDNSDHNNAPSAINVNTLSPQYAWSVVSGNATIVSNTGVLTLGTNVTGNIVVRLTVSNISPLEDKTFDFTLTRATVAQSSNASTVLTVPTISPLSANIGGSGSQTFTASATATTTTNTVPAHTSLTGGGNTYLYYDGSLYTSTNDFAQASETHPDITYTWTLTGAANSYLSPTSGTGASFTITHSTQTPSNLSSTLSVTATAAGQTQASASNATVTALASTEDPTAVNITSANPITMYVGNTGSISYTLSPSPCYSNVTFTSANTGIATVSAAGVVTGVAAGQTTISVKAYKYSNSAQYVEATVTVNVKDICATPTIVFTPTGSGSDATVTISSATAGADIYYTVNGTNPTTSSEHYTNPFIVTDGTEVRAIAAMTGNANWDNSAVATEEYHACTTAEPTITYKQPGTTATVTVTAEPGATIYYTTNGDDPTTGSASGSSPLTVGNVGNCTFKAIAKNAACQTSTIASTVILLSGVSGSVVTLNDLEDHTWTYYSAKPDNDYPDALHSPDPRNVKITYYANGYRHDGNTFTAVTGVQLSHNETANTFVYYETLEKTPGGQILTGNYPYKVIPNPFSKRPKDGNTYYGFEGWRIKSGEGYINGHNKNDILALEEVLHLEHLDTNYAPNVISAEIVLEAIWAPATVVTNSTTGLSAGYSYERNFVVCNTNISISNTANATVSSRYPDGTLYGDANTTVNGITVGTNPGDIKVEFIKVSGTFNGPNNKWLIVGRGCEGEISQTLGQQNNVKFRLESGTHVYVHPRPNTTGIMVMGSDYDRAQGDNSRLRIVNYVTANGGGAPAANSIAEFMDITIKSGFYGFKSELEPNDTYGNYGLGVGGNTDNTTYTPDPALGGSGTYYNYSGTASGSWQRTLSFYCGGTRGGGTGGIIRVMIEGGELSSLNGGGTKNQAANYGVIMHHIRMKGGWVKGALYGTASASSSAGSTRLVITGGEVNGWVAGACNGTRSDGDYHGELQGNCFIYVGGNAELRSHNNDGVYNNRWGLVFNVQGGTVFGAGKGIDDRVNYVGSANSTIVSVSDNAYIEQAVYGGAFHGVSKESRIYLTGSARVGNVYGGSFEPVHADNEATWRCNNTDIRMYGGNVTGGIYGGHNAKGTVYQTTSLLINGGQVGIDADHTANIHGGGYGNVTSVNGNVSVTLGDSPANSGGVTVYGNVFGGSALGDVNTNSSNTTIVTLNKGTVNGNLFGGALGEGADVNGMITVTVNGGTVNGNVFGGGDAAAYSPNANYPVVNMTGGQATNVFGGGMGNTAVVTGNPQVTLSGTAHVTGNVYGGGNAAPVTGNTSVILQD